MPNPYLLIDSDILIDHTHSVPQATAFLQASLQSYIPAISAVTEMELIIGCRNKAELRTIEKFLKKFRVLPLNATISAQAVKLLKSYRLSHGLLMADALIASTAMTNNIAFISKNQRDYRFIPGLQLQVY